MTKLRIDKKAHTFRGAAALIAAAFLTLLFTGCPGASGPNNKPAQTPKKYDITFSVPDGNGTLKAKADGVAETEQSPISVEEGKTVTFTATPNTDYKVDSWRIAGGVFEENTGADESTTAKVKITADTTVKVSFKVISVEGGVVLTLGSKKDITVTAKTHDGSPIEVEGCTELAPSNGVETMLHPSGTTVILKGEITGLSCSDNQLTALTVQGLPALKELDCKSNQLASLKVKDCASLQKIYCQQNKLTALDVQDLPALQDIFCYQNQLASLKVKGCSSLKKLSCQLNKLNAKAMVELLKALPTRETSDDAEAVLYSENASDNDENNKDFTKPEELKTTFKEAKTTKHWKLKKENTPGSEVEI